MKKEMKKLIYYILLITLIKEAYEISCDENCINCNVTNGHCKTCKKETYLSSFDFKCHSCFGEGEYYEASFTAEYQFISCTKKNQCEENKYKIRGTKECHEVCPTNYWIFNRICYEGPGCPENAIVDSSSPIARYCKCENGYYYKEDKDKSLICLTKNEPCPENKNTLDIITKECIKKEDCTNVKHYKLRKVIKFGMLNYECIANCESSEKYNGNINECVPECEEGKYYDPNDSTRECKDCINPKFKSNTDKKCLSACDSSQLSIIDSDTAPNKNECINQKLCPDSHPYLYEDGTSKYCIKNCLETNTNIFTASKRKKTYEYYGAYNNNNKDDYRNIKMCLPDCSVTEKKFILEGKECVSECPKAWYSNKCYDNCLIAGQDIGREIEYYRLDTKQCERQCPFEYYYDSDKICYKNCLETVNKTFHFSNSKECTSCKSSDEGYYVHGKEDYICYKNSCPKEAPYHNLGDNECFKLNGCNSAIYQDIDHMYYAYDSPYICLPNCTSIKTDNGLFTWEWKEGENYKTEHYKCLKELKCPLEYPYEYNKICYEKGCPDPNMVTIADTANKIFTCKYAINCTNYIQDDKCVPSCDETIYHYFIKPSSNLPGRCLKEIVDCYNLGFFYVLPRQTESQANECVEKCNTGDFIIQKVPGEKYPYYRQQGTCVSQCPNDFPYKYEKGGKKECYKEKCPDDLPFSDAGEHETNTFICKENCGEILFEYKGSKCVTNCKDTGDDKYSIKNEKTGGRKCVKECLRTQFMENNMCVDNCTINSFYHPITRECKSISCLDYYEVDGYGFTPEREDGDNSTLACLRSCPGGTFYYEDKKVCKKNCTDGHYLEKGNGAFICVETCNSNFLDNYTNTCVEKCPLYYYKSKINNENIKICVDSCDFLNRKNENGIYQNYSYIRNSTGECVSVCPADEGYLSDGICYKKCPFIKQYFKNITDKTFECYTQCDTNEFYEESKKNCLPTCPSWALRVVEGTNICLKNCPKDYPVEHEINGNFTCSKICGGNEVSKPDGTCIPYCSEGLFLDVRNRTCLEICPDHIRYHRNVSYNATVYYNICIPLCNSFEYISHENECVDECEPGYNFIGKGNECRDKCDVQKDGGFYTLLGKSSKNPSFNIYKCQETCNDGVFVFGDEDRRLCNETCNGLYKSPLGVCYDICNKDNYYKYSYYNGTGEKLCKDGCEYPLSYYSHNKTCKSKCDEEPFFVISEYNECIEECNRTNSNYKYELNGKCVLNCTGEKNKHYEGEYNCTDKCEAPRNYIMPGNICTDKCSGKYPYAVNNSKSEFICFQNCPYKMFLNRTGAECVDKCSDNYFVIEGTNICIEDCTTENKKYYRPSSSTGSTFPLNTCVSECYGSDQPFTLTNNTCSIECDAGEVYLESDYKCINYCPEGYKNKNGSMCVSKCPINEINKFLNENKECVKECNFTSKFIYYIPGIYECLEKCPAGYYLNNNTNDYQCLKKCPSNRPYYNGTMCSEKCPDGQFVVEKYNHYNTLEGEFPQQTCDVKCPEKYPYYIQINGEQYYKCLGQCPPDKKYWINVSGKGRECSEKCVLENKFVNPDYQCNASCIDTYKYYIDGTENLVCLSKCPIDHPFYNPSTTICIEKCDNFADFYTKECVNDCSNKYWGIYNSTKYCLGKCEMEFGFFVTPNKQCVPDCNQTEFLWANFSDYKCECANLYYKDESNFIKCYNPNILDCVLTENNYTFLKENTLECQKDCPLNKISPNKTCLSDVCNHYPKFFETQSGECICRYNYFKNELNKSVCLEEFENCPPNKTYYINETRECVYDCPSENYTYKYYHSCLSKCPNGTKADDEKKCKITNYWYREDDSTIVYLDSDKNCSDTPNNKYPLLIEKTKECVKKCKGSDYFIFYENKCLSSCTEAENAITMIEIEKNDIIKKDYAIYTCLCNDLWYYDNETYNGTVCTGEYNTKTYDNCSQINKDFKFQVKKTKECVKSCPDEYPFSFNDECFKDCSEANSFYAYDFKIKDGKECGCPKVWKNVSLGGEYYRIKCEYQDYCVNDTNGPYLLINDTKECFHGNKCPDGYNLFNGICYKGSCPDDSRQSSSENQCKCKNLWYKENNPHYPEVKDIFCISDKKQECPFPRFSYEINMTHECVNECKMENGSDYLIFNYKCYESCPENTTQEENTQECKCNKESGKWYQFYNERIYLGCGLLECPKGRKNLTNETNECVNSCEEKKYYHYNSTCYIDGCPNKTKVKAGTQFECEYRNLDNAFNLTELRAIVEEDILKLYEITPPSGYIYDRFNTTLQIYYVNKKNLGDDVVRRSNLTLVNISNCIDDIYKAYNLPDNSNIIIVKYDIHNDTQEYLTNKVEYEFYTTDGRKIPTSTCKDNSIIVSYPVTYKLDKNVEFSNDKYLNKLKNIFDIGKELKKVDEKVELFDFNNSIFHDICVPCEVNGKDVLLKDRQIELYPNISVCENNCSFYYTDYNTQRVYCNCSIKNDFDFYRTHTLVSNKFDINEADKLQKGPTNVPTIKCISNLVKDRKRAVTNNPAFYITLFTTIAEVALVFVSTMIGYGAITTKINKRLNLNNDKNEKDPKGDNNDDYLSEYTENTNKDKNDNVVSSQRELSSSGSNPPKRENILSPDDSEENKKEENDSNSGSQKNKLAKSNSDEDFQNEINTNKKKNQNPLPLKNPSNNDEEFDNRDLITIKKLSPKKFGGTQSLYTNKQDGFDVVQLTRKTRNIKNIKYNEKIEEEEDNVYNERLLMSIRNEGKNLRAPYEYSCKKDKSDLLVMILTEVFDKIYFLKTFFLYRKYDIFSIMVSIYLLYHILVLALSTVYYNIEKISKIYHTTNFPELKDHIIYGAITFAITWVIYGLLLFLVRQEKRINSVVMLKNNNINKGIKDEDLVNKRHTRLIKAIKISMIAYFIIQFLLLIFSFLYIVSFCAVYTGTKKLVFLTYGISLLEILIFKIAYGIILGIFRYISLACKSRCLYKVVRFIDNYIP